MNRPESRTESLRKAIALDPDNAVAHCALGGELLRQGRPDEALTSFRTAVALQPDLAEAHFNSGNALADLGRFEEALRSFDRTIALAPAVSVAYYNRGNVRRALKKFAEALADYDRAVELRPDHAHAYSNRGTALLALGRTDEALASFDQAIGYDPNLAEAHYNKANVLRDKRRLVEAMAGYRQAIELKPRYAEAHNNIGSVLADLARPDEALEHYDRAIEFDPRAAAGHVNRGNVLKDLGRPDEALADYRQALELEPELDFLYGALLHTKMKLCDWQGTPGQVLDLSSRIARGERVSSPFPVVTLTNSEAIQRKAAEIWVAERYPPQATSKPRATEPGAARIRLGYYSADFRDHATTFLMAGLFEHHDRSRFELFAFSFGDATNDTMRQRVSAAFDRFIDVRDLPDADVARLSRELGIDIAIDLKGFTQGHRAGIFAHRAAPVQVNYLGFPGTMGAGYIDYLVADRTTVPVDRRQHYSEMIAYLPHSYQANDRTRPIGDVPPTRQSVGLPEAGMVFCCFNNSYKIAPEIFDCWMRILTEANGSVLWLLADNATAADALRREAGARGVDPRRLVFARRVSPAEHLARHQLADLFLDTLPCNAHTTASDALWAGLPVLTCLGETFAGRVAASLLNAVDLPELIATTLDEYERLAIALARDPRRREATRSRLVDNRLATPLFDTALTTRNLEALYLQMHDRFRSDLPPAHLFA